MFLSRVLKLAVGIVLTWLVMAVAFLGLSLPETPEATVASRISAGTTIERVYEADKYFQTKSLEYASLLRSHFAISIKYQAQQGDSSSTLIINSDAFFPLTFDLPSETTPRHVLETQVRTGDTDGLSPPWFETADAALLFYFIHRERMVLPMELVRRNNTNASVEHGPAIFDLIVVNTHGSSSRPPSPPVLLTITSPSSSLHTHPLFSFPRASSAPSMTYPIRRIILLILVPIALLFMLIASAAVYVLKFVALGVGLWAAWFLWNLQRQGRSEDGATVIPLNATSTPKVEVAGVHPPLGESRGDSPLVAPVAISSFKGDVQEMV